MSTTVDSKVVSMQFDNKHFEKNVQTSLGTIGKLKQSLNLDGATKGLENVSNTAKGIKFSGLTSAVDTVQARFSAMGVIGVTALANITNSAVNAGKRMVSALTIDPITAGFSEYETKINAIQTIMANTASKGTTMEDVTKVINELNTYADKTIYNFAEMTRNIGTFTAAGVGLEESASAIQGIANLAAVSGSNSQQASTAMYQLSQAMASGTVKLMDWNSVVNAGMGGEVFQNALKDTARTHGVAVDDIIEEMGSFRESLSEGWLTTEILTETLSKMTKSGAAEYLSTLTGIELSQITAAQQLVAENKDGTASYDELAKTLSATGKITEDEALNILKMADTAEDAATKIKTFTQLWDTLKESAQSGWSQTWEILIGDFEEAKETLTEFSDLIGGMISASADARNELLQGWKDAGGRADLIDSLYNVFDGILSIVKPIKEAFREIFPPMTVEQLVKFTEGLKNLTAKFKLNDEQSKNLKATFKGLFSIIDIGITFIKEVVGGIITLLGNFSGLGDCILGVTAAIGGWVTGVRDSVKETNVFGTAVNKIVSFIQTAIDKIKEFYSFVKEKIAFPGFEGFLMILGAIWNVIQKVGKKVSEIGLSIGKALSNALRSGNLDAALDVFNTGVFAAILLGIRKFVKGLSDIFDGAGGILENISGILQSVKGCFEAYQQDLKANVLLKIAIAIGILSLSLLLLATIDPGRLTTALIGIGALFGELMGAMAIFDQIPKKSKGVVKSVVAMIGMSVAVLILASAVKKISDLELDQLVIGLVGVGALCAMMVAVTKALSKDSKKMMKGALQIVIFAAAIKVLASACIDLSVLPFDNMVKGLIGVGILLAEIAIFLKVAKFNNKALGTALGIIAISAAMKILASVCADFGAMDWGVIGKGLIAIGVLLLEIALFTKLTGNAKKVIATATALVLISSALKILVGVLQEMGKMTWGEIGRGLVALAGALLAVAVAMKLMPKNLFGLSIGLVIVASALVILANVLSDMGGMSWDEIAKGLVALGGSLVIMAIGLNLMKKTFGASVALALAAVSLAILTPVLKSLGSMSWESIGKGLVAIAGAFAVVGIAGALLKPVIPTILALALAFTLFGVASIGIGVGINAIAIGLGLLATVSAGAATAIVAALTIIIGGIAALIPTIIREIGLGIVELFTVIGDSAHAIGYAVSAIVKVVIEVLVEHVPALVDGVLVFVVSVLHSLVEHTPVIVEAVFDFLVAVINSIAAKIPGLVQAIVDLFLTVFDSVIDVLGSIDPSRLLEGVVCIGILTAVVVALAALAVLTPLAMVGVIGMGLVVTELALVLGVIGGTIGQMDSLASNIEDAIDILGLVGRAIGTFIGELIGGIAGSIFGSLPQIAADLSMFMTNLQPFLMGARLIDASVLEGIAAIVGVIAVLTAADVLHSLTSWLTGGSSIADFAEELVPFGEAIVEFSDVVSGNVDSDAVTAAANAGKMMAEMASTLPNSGGVAGFFAGENDMSDFSKQLIPFGQAIVDFSKIVAGNVDSDAVTAAANAGETMANFADTIPNSGGVVEFFTGGNDMDTFGEMLVSFGHSIVDFSDVVSGRVDADAVQAAANAGIMMSNFADTIPNSGGVVGFFTGNNDMDTFGKQIRIFGDHIVQFSKTVSGNIDLPGVTSAKLAGDMMVALANTIPNTGGVVDFFTGSNDMSTFGGQIVLFGYAIKTFSKTVSGAIDLASVNAASLAGQMMANLQDRLPKSGGVVQFFTGTTDWDGFNDGIRGFGRAITTFSRTVAGKIDLKDVSDASVAGQMLAKLGASLPAQTVVQSIVTKITGISQWSAFNDGIKGFGRAIVSFSSTVAGKINSSDVSKAANAGSVLSKLASNLPDQSALKMVVSKITGITEWDLFNTGIVGFAEAMVDFSEELEGVSIDTTVVSSVTNMGQMLSGLATSIGTSTSTMDHVIAWFSGETDWDLFGDGIVTFAKSLHDFNDEIAGLNIDPVKFALVCEAAESLGALAEGVGEREFFDVVLEFFGAKSDMEAFADGLEVFGMALGELAADTEGFDEVTMTNINKGFDQVVELMKTVKDNADTILWDGTDDGESSIIDGCYAWAVAFSHIDSAFKNSDPDHIQACAKAFHGAMVKMKYVWNMMNQLDESGEAYDSMSSFGDLNLENFALEIKEFASSLDSINSEQFQAVITSLGSLVDTVVAIKNNDIDIGYLKQFMDSLNEMGDHGVRAFVEAFTNDQTAIDCKTAARTLGSYVLTGMHEFITGDAGSHISTMMASITAGVAATGTLFKETGTSLALSLKDGFTAAKIQIGIAAKLMAVFIRDTLQTDFTAAAKGCVASLTGVFIDAGTIANLALAGHAMFNAVGIGIIDEVALNMPATIATAISSMIATIGGYYDEFVKAGKNLVNGFAEGISVNTYIASARSRAMARAAATAAEEELDEHSPSRVGYRIGDFFGLGFVNAIDNYATTAYKTSSNMATSAKMGLGDAIGKIRRMMDDDIDVQPTIRPVVDLTDVETKANAINGMFGMNPSVGVLSKMRTVSSMMNESQNGANDDVISAINNLGKSLGGNTGDTYQINGITYDDGSNINEAIKTLVRAARVERRT